jgi:type I restriction enzyme, S subunit
MAGKPLAVRTIKLRECAVFQEGYVNPSQTVAEYFGDEVKWLRAVDLNDSFVWETSRRLSRLGYESAGKASLLFKPDTLAISKSGTIGRLGILKDYMCGNRAVINISVDLSCYDCRFIFYSLLWRRAAIEELATGSVQRNLYCSVLGELEIEVPPLAEQKAIAEILGALDDKIELNRRMNATLEGMARALFQSWFVDFDPVRAKLDGRQPVGLDAATAALFPGRFQESELGRIPRGWSVGSILTQAELLSGGTPKTSEAAYWDGGVPWASAKDVSQCGDTFLVTTERTITQRGLQESSTKMIPAFATVIVARGATTGRLTMFAQSMAMNQTCYGLQSRLGAPLALYCHAREFSDKLVHGAHGSVFDTITTRTFETTQILLPPPEIQEAFDAKVHSLFDRIRVNLRQSRTLAKIVDGPCRRPALPERLMLPIDEQFRRSPQQDQVVRALVKRYAKVAGWYESALRQLATDASEARLCGAAHLIRLMLNEMPRFFELPQLMSLPAVAVRLAGLDQPWEAACASPCRTQDGWSGEIDPAVGHFLVEFAEFHTANRAQPSKRKIAGDALRLSDPTQVVITGDLVEQMAVRWIELHKYFGAIAHGSESRADRFPENLAEVEGIVLLMLRDKPSESLATIDAIFAEEQAGA